MNECHRPNIITAVRRHAIFPIVQWPRGRRSCRCRPSVIHETAPLTSASSRAWTKVLLKRASHGANLYQDIRIKYRCPPKHHESDKGPAFARTLSSLMQRYVQRPGINIPLTPLSLSSASCADRRHRSSEVLMHSAHRDMIAALAYFEACVVL